MRSRLTLEALEARDCPTPLLLYREVADGVQPASRQQVLTDTDGPTFLDDLFRDRFAYQPYTNPFPGFDPNGSLAVPTLPTATAVMLAFDNGTRFVSIPDTFPGIQDRLPPGSQAFVNPGDGQTWFILTPFEGSTLPPPQTDARDLDVARGIANSDEALGRTVQDVYGRFLGRDASPGEVTLWVNGFRSGLGEQRFVATVLASPEFASTANGDWLAAAYQRLFGRAVDGDGRSHWNGVLRTGSVFDVALSLATSDEANRLRIQGAYGRLLRRDADGPGLDFWASQLAGGLSYRELDAQLAASVEYRSQRPDNTDYVRDLYFDLLGREADAAGLASWLARLA